MTTLINKNGQISKTAYEKVSNYGHGFSTRKLSDLYSSRSTNYHSIYNSDLFIINRKKEDIVAAGYSPLCKAIISLNESNPLVKQILQMEIERLKAKKASDKIESDKKEAFKSAILAEANSVSTDQDFAADLKWAGEVSGAEKSDRMASAMKALLSRNSIEKVDTDFWQVFRILKAKAEKV